MGRVCVIFGITPSSIHFWLNVVRFSFSPTVGGFYTPMPVTRTVNSFLSALSEFPPIVRIVVDYTCNASDDREFGIKRHRSEGTLYI